MDYPKHMFRIPGPYGAGDRTYAVAGAADEEAELSLMERGWHASKEDAWTASVLDHDGDGKAGGSLKQTGPDLTALRAEYKELAGKKPFGGWSEAELRERIAALKEE